MSETTHSVEITDLLEELDWRGLLKDCTDREGLEKHLSDPSGAPRKIYAGFDPTADSLTIGNLVPIMLLAHVRRAGHTPVVVMGGGTGLIGDPSGKSAERQLNTPEIINGFIDKQRPIYSAVLGEESKDFELRNNYKWLSGISYIEALRDIGKHFSVNMMMQKESVKERLTNREQGISYTEFSYMILQAYDFAWLYENANVTVQFGGSDQYGNIVAGSDLIRRTTQDIDDEQSKSFGLTAPLVQKADGGKFGKTESGAVWLTAARTSPYAYYQFWLNASDEDAKNWIKVFTFLSKDEVESLIARHDEAPGRRELQRTLAQQATSILHGQDAMENAEAAGKALFSGEVASLDQSTLVEVFASVPTTDHAKAGLKGEGVDPVELLIECNLASSKREARDFLGENSVSINGEKINGDTRIVASHLLHGSYIAIRRGKKKWHMTQWS
jgi:tyrosyl-tRNA synthetase